MGAVHAGYGVTWAKVILMGEHSVVYGYPAVAVPIRALTMEAWVKPIARGVRGEQSGTQGADSAGVDSKTYAMSPHRRNVPPQDRLHALDYDGALADAGTRFGGVEEAVKVATAFAGCPDQAFDVTTKSTFPAGRGMGSSAASAGAVIRAILDACDIQASHADILKLTNEAEVITHGNPSGLDAATTSSFDTVVFESGEMSTMAIDMPAYLVVADSGIEGSTREAVGSVREQDARDHGRVKAAMDELGGLARASVEDLQRGAVLPLGGRMDRAHDLLAGLKVSHPFVDRLVEAARGAGAVGAKMTGGGLGGCLIALAPDAVTAQRVRVALLSEGAREVWTYPLDIDAAGSADGVDGGEVGGGATGREVEQ
ncbi:mevalonate kinase [Bifidobacterium bohemicum]|uniref:Mevalonate kinase n=1 Tax=Bifidobacterium bohemicum DSM 22767 TaxID=1437606 RepID=A0A086ZHN5_9BIFI|nr:mevalonate kinase [Bifidobacterium bohemicum]KFI46035.1 mevalonate kinase [Bifidobacterium bohemicum DSM 22767]SCC05326.1 mevalonate kinase [Bifidobacterium bohemicum]